MDVHIQNLGLPSRHGDEVPLNVSVAVDPHETHSHRI